MPEVLCGVPNVRVLYLTNFDENLLSQDLRRGRAVCTRRNVRSEAMRYVPLRPTHEHVLNVCALPPILRSTTWFSVVLVLTAARLVRKPKPLKRWVRRGAPTEAVTKAGHFLHLHRSLQQTVCASEVLC